MRFSVLIAMLLMTARADGQADELTPPPPPPGAPQEDGEPPRQDHDLPAPWTDSALDPVPPPPDGSSQPPSGSLPPASYRSTQSTASTHTHGVPTLRAEPPAQRRSARRAARRLRLFPLRAPGHHLRLELRPFFSERANGFIAIPEWIFRGRRAFWAHLRLGPVGFGRADGDNVGVLDLSAAMGVDTRAFSLAVGAGLAFARVDEVLRRARGLTPTANLELRLGALDGLHMEWAFSGTQVGQDVLVTSARMRVRVPVGRGGNLLDVEMAAAPHLAYIYMLIGVEMIPWWNRESHWRIRPNAGITEVIDPVRRDGGPGFTLGMTVVYRALTEPETENSSDP